jgi:hypothetical protein
MFIINEDTRKHHGKADQATLPWALANTMKYSGTDNGLVSMTETVGFTMDRFLFHLDLYSHSPNCAFTTTRNKRVLQRIVQKS